jgi:hypothetical protein
VALFARLVPILSKKLFTVVECVRLCTVTLLNSGSPGRPSRKVQHE